MGIYAIKPAFRRLLTPVAAAMTRLGVSADAVTTAGLVFAGLAGLGVWLGREGSAWLLLVPLAAFLRTAANGLDAGAGAANAVPALLSALKRITEQQRETSRDPRMAIVGALIRFGVAVPTTELEPYLRDFDSAVAGRIAEALTSQTGNTHTPKPTLLPRLPLPTPDETSALDATRAVLHMDGGGEIELRLLGSEAPTNAARFVRLARSGYFDGLTFHRVVPNFVIQGGSPGANEYAGDGPYTRDELTARPHLRGTVGISTRGRDTGDAQIFVNLVDNVRLDHNYTIFAEVTAGMNVADTVVEGATIERITIHER
ncbi:MAG: peptidylprolyl isomerase [Gemmatimonadetes bacterium]|nr:peptidylprolyl isomerase [Gemmatimonadota bacterium]